MNPARDRTPDPGHRIPDTGYRIPDPGSPDPAFPLSSVHVRAGSSLGVWARSPERQLLLLLPSPATRAGRLASCAGLSTRADHRQRDLRGRPDPELRALPSVGLHAGTAVEPAPRLPPRRSRPGLRREISGRCRALRLHRRGVEQFQKWFVGSDDPGGAGDVARCGPPLLGGRAARLSDWPLWRRPRGHGGGARAQRHRRRDRVERRVPGRGATPLRQVRRFRHRRHGRLQLSRAAPARCGTHLTALPGHLRGRTRAAAGRALPPRPSSGWSSRPSDPVAAPRIAG